MDERSREQLDRMDPERRAKVEAILARTNTPERRAGRLAAREAIAAEVRATGGVTAEDGTFYPVRVPGTARAAADAGSRLKAAREDLGLSIEDVVRASGIERSALFKLEGGKNPNPTVGTLERYARALGGRIVIDFAPGAAESAP